MKRRILVVAALVLAGASPAFGNSTPIGNARIAAAQEAQSVANAIEDAARANDNDKANSYFAADCVFHTTYPVQGGVRQQTLTREQYLDEQAKAKAEGTDEVYKSNAPVVTVLADKVTAKLQATDSQIDHHKSVTTVSDQVETFGERDGRLMVVAVDVTVVSVTVDGKTLF